MKSISEFRGYKIPVWDIVEMIDTLPIQRGPSAYHAAYRETINAYFADCMNAVTLDDNASVHRGDLLNMLKGRSREATHALMGATELETQERQLARQDAYAALYDAVRENL